MHFSIDCGKIQYNTIEKCMVKYNIIQSRNAIVYNREMHEIEYWWYICILFHAFLHEIEYIYMHEIEYIYMMIYMYSVSCISRLYTIAFLDDIYVFLHEIEYIYIINTYISSTYGWVTSYTWMSHVTHTNESRHAYESEHVTRRNQSYHMYIYIYESIYTYIYVYIYTYICMHISYIYMHICTSCAPMVAVSMQRRRFDVTTTDLPALPVLHVRHDAFIRGKWLIHMWDMTDWYIGHDSLTCVTILNHSAIWRHNHRLTCFACITCGTWLVHTWDITHSYVLFDVTTTDLPALPALHVGHDSFTRGACTVYMWDMTHSCVGHNSFICHIRRHDHRLACFASIACVTWLDSYVEHDWFVDVGRVSFICQIRRRDYRLARDASIACMTWLNSYVEHAPFKCGHDPLKCGTWLIHM